MNPLDAFPLILLLLLFQNQLNKQLLQLLIAIIDTKLLKGVVIKDLKAIDIEYANDSAVLMQRRLDERRVDGRVDVTDDPGEETVVQRLGEGVA